jgi:hypothetical protein
MKRVFFLTVSLTLTTSTAMAYEKAVDAWARQQGEAALAGLPEDPQKRDAAFWSLDSLRFAEALKALQRQLGVGGALQRYSELVSALPNVSEELRARVADNSTELAREIDNIASGLGNMLRTTAAATLSRLASVEGQSVAFRVSAMVAFYRLGANQRAAEQATAVIVAQNTESDLFHAAYVSYTQRFLSKHPELSAGIAGGLAKRASRRRASGI